MTNQKQARLTGEELLSELRNNNVFSLADVEFAVLEPTGEDNVFLGQVDSAGDLFLDLFDDAVQVPQPKVREMLYASLEQAQANMESFALETEDQRD